MPKIHVLALSALIPLVTGFIWYHPKVLANAWMDSAGITEDTLKKGNMALIFGLTFILSFFMAFLLNGLVVHQSAMMSLLVMQPGFEQPGSEVHTFFENFNKQYGSLHRSFGHGAVHGTMAGLFFATPLIAINAMFERRSFKYVAIHAGYWIITLLLMGGVICQFA